MYHLKSPFKKLKQNAINKWQVAFLNMTIKIKIFYNKIKNDITNFKKHQNTLDFLILFMINVIKNDINKRLDGRKTQKHDMAKKSIFC